MEKNYLKRNFNNFLKMLILLTLFAFVITGIYFSENNKSYAEEGIATLSLVGSGTSEDPYLIRVESDLIYMATQCNNATEGFQSAYYKQVDNITLTSTWTKINSFSGTYDGQGYLIKGLTNTNIDFAFFQKLESTAVIKNLGFTEVSYNVSSNDAYDIATLAIENIGTISNCFASGVFNLKVSGIGHHLYSAGLVSYMNEGLIENCYNDVDITVDAPGVNVSYMNVGGIACELNGGNINDCYNIGILKIEDGSLYWKIGGIVAKDGNGGKLYNCAILENSCSVNGNIKNNVIQYNVGSGSLDRENTGVISESNLKNTSVAPLSSWEWNTTNSFPRVWGFVSDTTSEFYNGGFPQLRVFYEYFFLDVYTENGSSLITTKVTRYPDYSFDLSDIVAPVKKGHTFNGEFTLEKNSVGDRFSGLVSGICDNYVAYAAYDINYYRLYVKIFNPLSSGLVERDEMIAYNTLVTINMNGVTPGYRFVEWKDLNTHAMVSDHENPTFNMPDYDLEVYPEFVEYTYFVKLKINDTSLGSVSGAYDYYYAGETVTLMAQPKEGYTVSKYYLDDGTILSENEVYSFVMTNKNMVINVDFVPKLYSLTVKSYPENLVTTTGSGQYYKGDKVDIGFSNIPEGYIFAGWKIENIDSKSLYADKVVTHDKDSRDETLYCCFITSDNYVAFVDNNKVVSEHIVSSGVSITPPQMPLKKGYTFVGWYTKEENGSEITSFDNVTYSFNAYARYEKTFDCTISISMQITDRQLNAKESTIAFVALKTDNETYNLSLDKDTTKIFKLLNMGEYTIEYVLPTFYDVVIYKDGEVSSNSFDVTLNDSEIKIQLVLTNTLDKWLHDSQNFYNDITIEDTVIVDPVIEIGNEQVYVGVEPSISDIQFNELNSSEIPVSPYGYDIKDVLGATHFGGLYNFTELDYLQEGANFVAKDLGSSVYRIALLNGYEEMYPFNPNWGTKSITSLTDIVKTPAYTELFERQDISTYILVSYEHVLCPWDRVVSSNYELSDLDMYFEYVKQEFKELTKYLLTTYSNSGKTFILSNWQGDNAFAPYFDICTTDEQRQNLTDAFVKYINSRQDGIIEGRKSILGTSSSSTNVFGNFEVNHIGQNIPNVPNRWRLTDVAVPYTYSDLYSFSDGYSGTQDSSGNYLYPLEDLLDELYSKVQTNLSYTNPTEYPTHTTLEDMKNIMITEFYYDENTNANFDNQIQHEIKTAIEWGCYKVVYWLTCSNTRVVESLYRPNNDEMQGVWLIRPDGTLTHAFWYMKSIISGVDYITTAPKLVFEVTEVGVDWIANAEDIIFKDDLVDTFKMKDFSSNGISLYEIDSSSEDYKNYEEFNKHYGEVDTTGIVQSENSNKLKYITYEMKSNKFGILLYNYNSYFNYEDIDGNKLDGLIKIEGKNKSNNWEEIKGLRIEQIQSSREDGSLYWFQTCITGTAQIGKFSELRISFVNKNYNELDPIITSVVFFEGGQAWIKEKVWL